MGMNSIGNRGRIGVGTAMAIGLAALVVVGGQTGHAGSNPAAGSAAHGFSSDESLAAWLTYRAGERGDPQPPDPTLAAWLDYRAGERGDPQPPDPTLAAWLDYRAGERAVDNADRTGR
jgi:hypothetical protein